jgi:hypothetical protein
MATEAKNVEAPPADAKKEELKAIREDLRALQIQRRSQRTRLIRFQRNHKYIAKRLPENAEAETDEAKQACVKLTYQLLRTFCFAFNCLHLDKEAEKFFIPKDFEAELKEVMTDKYFSAFANAIKASKEEFKTQLPDNISKEVGERLLKFVSVKEKDHVITKYEDAIKDLTDKIEGKAKERDAIQPPAPKTDKKDKNDKKDKKQRKRRNSDSSDQGKPLEDRLHNILKEVSKRTSSVRFSKDDFASYSEAQSQVDALLRETVTEILAMKQDLRKKFARAQKGGGRRRSSNRRERREKA